MQRVLTKQKAVAVACGGSHFVAMLCELSLAYIPARSDTERMEMLIQAEGKMPR